MAPNASNPHAFQRHSIACRAGDARGRFPMGAQQRPKRLPVPLSVDRCFCPGTSGTVQLGALSTKVGAGTPSKSHWGKRRNRAIPAFRDLPQRRIWTPTGTSLSRRQCAEVDCSSSFVNVVEAFKSTGGQESRSQLRQLGHWPGPGGGHSSNQMRKPGAGGVTGLKNWPPRRCLGVQFTQH